MRRTVPISFQILLLVLMQVGCATERIDREPRPLPEAETETMTELDTAPDITVEWSVREGWWADTVRHGIWKMDKIGSPLPYVAMFRVLSPEQKIVVPQVSSKDESIATVETNAEGVVTLSLIGPGQTEVTVEAIGHSKLLRISTTLKDGELTGEIDVVTPAPGS